MRVSWAILALCMGQALAANTNVSFVQYLELAKENDPNLSLIMADKERTRFLVDLGLPARQLLLQASSEYGVGTRDDENTNRNNLSLSQNFTETGTTLRVGFSKNDLADRSEEVTEIRLEQSLWRNMFGKQTRMQRSALEDEVKSLSLQVVDTYENYLAQLGELYLEYAQAWSNVELAKNIYRETVALKDNVAKMLKNNIASQTDYERAQLQVALRQEDVLELQTNLQALASRLIASANLSQTTVEPDLASFESMLSRLRIDGVEYEELRVAKIAAYREKSAATRVELAKRLNRPSLNLVAGYNIDESSRFGTVVNREERLLGVSLSVPFGDTLNKARQQEASLEKLKSELTSFGTRRQSMQEFQSLKVRLENAKKVYELNQSKVKLAQKVYEADLQRYQYGNLELDRLIEAKNAFSTYRYQKFASLADYYKAALRWMDLTDVLVVKE